MLQAGEQEKRFPVRPQIEEILRRDLPGHHRVLTPALAEEIKHAPELTDAHPFDRIDFFSKPRIGFAGERGGNDFLHARRPS